MVDSCAPCPIWPRPDYKIDRARPHRPSVRPTTDHLLLSHGSGLRWAIEEQRRKDDAAAQDAHAGHLLAADRTEVAYLLYLEELALKPRRMVLRRASGGPASAGSTWHQDQSRGALAWRGASVRGLGCHSADATGHSGQVALAVRSAACICGTCMYMWHVQGLAGCNHEGGRRGTGAQRRAQQQRATLAPPRRARTRGPAQTQSSAFARHAALASRAQQRSRAGAQGKAVVHAACASPLRLCKRRRRILQHKAVAQHDSRDRQGTPTASSETVVLTVAVVGPPIRGIVERKETHVFEYPSAAPSTPLAGASQRPADRCRGAREICDLCQA